jgi:hypothetical protein
MVTSGSEEFDKENNDDAIASCGENEGKPETIPESIKHEAENESEV